MPITGWIAILVLILMGYLLIKTIRNSSSPFFGGAASSSAA